jgi:predicted permease
MQADLSPVLYMLLLLGTGFALGKGRLLRSEHIGALPALLLNIAYPALIIRSVTTVDVRSLAAESIAVVVVTMAVTLALFFVGRRVLRGHKNAARRPLIIFSMAIGNIVYVALPVIRAVFGDIGVYYTMLHSTAQDVIIWTLYYALFVGGGVLRGMKLKKLVSPCFIALIIALVLAVLGIRPQGVFDDFLSGLGALTIPLALVYVGGVLALSGSIRDWIPDRDTVMISVAKVLIVPLAVFGVMQLVPVSLEIRVLLAVCFSAPATVMSTIWAGQYGFDEKFSIKVLISSTLLFLVAAGVFIVLYGSQNIGG